MGQRQNKRSTNLTLSISTQSQRTTAILLGSLKICKSGKTFKRVCIVEGNWLFFTSFLYRKKEIAYLGLYSWSSLPDYQVLRLMVRDYETGQEDHKFNPRLDNFFLSYECLYMLKDMSMLAITQLSVNFMPFYIGHSQQPANNEPQRQKIAYQ